MGMSDESSAEVICWIRKSAAHRKGGSGLDRSRVGSRASFGCIGGGCVLEAGRLVRRILEALVCRSQLLFLLWAPTTPHFT